MRVLRIILIIYYSSKRDLYMVFVVAEIGVNWDGNFETAKNMMKNAKSSGCNAVKFQSFDEEIIKNHPQKSRLIKSAISKNNIEDIDQLSKEIEIEWFCTPMTVEAVTLLNPYVKRFKIRELDGKELLENNITKLFESVLETGKPIMISSKENPKNSKFCNHPQIQWLYCIPKYPCSIEDINFDEISYFDGFSNHCPETIAPINAVNSGAQIVEIHITDDKSKDYFDNNVSFDYTDLNEIMKVIHSTEGSNN